MKKAVVYMFRKFSTMIFTIIAKFTLNDYRTPLRANGLTLLTTSTQIGNNVNFNGLRISGKGKCEIGNNFHSGYGVRILTSYHNYEGNKIPYDNTLITEDVTINNNVWLGINVIILPGVTIGEGAIVQAGSVVVSDIPKYSIVGGHPAKIFSERDIQHYKNLKEKEAFH